MNLRSLLLSVVVLVAAVSQSALQAQAQTWPQRTVKFIVPLGPGSGVDTTARLLANQLSARWGKPVVVENRPGGDGFVAIGAFVGHATTTHSCLLQHRRSRLIRSSMTSCRTIRGIWCRSPG